MIFLFKMNKENTFLSFQFNTTNHEKINLCKFMVHFRKRNEISKKTKNLQI